MKLVVFETETDSGGRRPGAMFNADGKDFVIDLRSAFADTGETPSASIAEVLAPEALAATAKIVDRVRNDSSIAQRKVVTPASLVRLMAPVPERPFVICTGANYFEPSDVMSTGSPPGVGMGRKLPIFMKPGDEVAITVDGIGTLRNSVAAG